MIRRLFFRASTAPVESALAADPPLGDHHRRQTDAILASLIRHGLLSDDEFELDEVYDHVRSNGPDDAGDPVEFAEVIGSVAHTLDPLTNLVFIPSWSELSSTDVEEFAESLCWLAGVNTSAAALPTGADPSDPTELTVRFELEPGTVTTLDVRLPSKGLPENLIEGLAELLGARIAPRQFSVAMCGGDCVVSALDSVTMTAINAETNAGYTPARPNAAPN